MLSSGVPILDALEIVSKTAGNYVVEQALLFTREKIAEGKTIVEPLAQTDVFPAMVVQMIGLSSGFHSRLRRTRSNLRSIPAYEPRIGSPWNRLPLR